MKQLRKLQERMQKEDGPLKRLASFVSRGRNKERDLWKNYKEIWIALILLVLVGGVIGLAFYGTVEEVIDEVEEIIDIDETAPRHPLTGALLEEELESLPQVFGVMVENSSDAWPLVGLESAFLVIEAPVEGNIPRFIAFYSEEDDVEQIGPVRSARPYYVDWNDALDAMYVHIGGSPEALDSIKYDYDTIDLNQFWYSKYFWRANGNRYAPHNVFTAIEDLIDALDEFDLDDPSYEPWIFGDGESKGNESLAIDWETATTYDVDWRYDAETNQYTRYQGRYLMEMEDGATIEADNIVVLETSIRVIDNVGRKRIETEGEGVAYIAQNGEVFLATWVKDERTSRLRFYTPDGYEITMNAGVTWIEVVSELSQAESYE